jgi:RNA polymerase sigma factor (TIGR02999 family)
MRENLKKAAKTLCKIFISTESKLQCRTKSQIRKFMSETQTSEITRILHDWNDGDGAAKEQLLPFVYDELKRQARFLMSAERSNHTLQPTALVHEAFLRLSEQTGVEWRDRSHFYGIASRLMRQILVDHARRHATAKRGNRPIHFSIDDVRIPIEERAEAILTLNEVLERFEKFDEQQARIVEMRFFGGMNNAEIAESLEISERTVGREWQAARLWLYRELNK